jgi:C1A family cysteine protease
MPTAAQMTEAANYKIASYSRLVSSDITAIKTMLVNKHPVIITINPDQPFWDAQPGFVWRSYTAAPGISHALIICGYDDAKHAYKVMNSWGTEWADAGFSWIDYDFFPQTAFYYSYVING